MERQEKANLSFLTGKWPLDKSKQNLIFLHGAGITALSWILQIKYFSDKANIIVPDLPGHGKSRGPGMDSISDYAKKISGLIAELKIKKCILAGTSMGGAIAQELLVNHPEICKAAILLNTGAKLKVLPAIFQAVKKDFKAFIIGMSDILFPANTEIKKIEPSLKDMIVIDKSIVLGDFTACDTFDIRKKLHKINAPVLVISSKNDIMTPVWYGEYLRNNIKKAKMMTIEGAGHLAQLEKPRVLNKAILEFIESL
ncbi:MAG: alpha/beta hydrolase [Spirochaetes bacterium]|nr:alpha/beta hydrolase [Spirochaetota bacterium]